MSPPLSKAELVKHSQAIVRAEWIRRLRAEGHRQCVGPTGRRMHIMRDGEPERIETVCAMVLLGEITHGPRWWTIDPARLSECFSLREIGAMAGLDQLQVGAVVHMNDGGSGSQFGKLGARRCTFRVIADTVEAWFA